MMASTHQDEPNHFSSPISSYLLESVVTICCRARCDGPIAGPFADELLHQLLAPRVLEHDYLDTPLFKIVLTPNESLVFACNGYGN
jgi:hypothetical protein